MNKTRKTVSKTVAISGYSFEVSWRRFVDRAKMGEDYTMRIHPANENTGIKLINSSFPNIQVPLDIFHTYSRNTFFARSVIVSDKTDINLTNDLPKKKTNLRFHVTEHLSSALHHLGITDAFIEVESSKSTPTEAFIPTQGYGISHYVNSLHDYVKDLKVPVPLVKVISSDAYVSPSLTSSNVVIVPSEKLSFSIDKSDLGKIMLASMPIELSDVYAEIDDHLDARPIARVDTLVKTLAWNLGDWRNYKAVSKDNYIIASFEKDSYDLIKEMHEKYQLAENESVAHGHLDRFGEVYSIAGLPVKGGFDFKNTNHPRSISALKYFVKNGSIQLPNELNTE